MGILPSEAVAYNSSKTALNAFTVMLAHELKDSNIKVNSADPAYTATDLNGHNGYKTVEQGASVIVELGTLPEKGATGSYFDDKGVFALVRGSFGKMNYTGLSILKNLLAICFDGAVYGRQQERIEIFGG